MSRVKRVFLTVVLATMTWGAFEVARPAKVVSAAICCDFGVDCVGTVCCLPTQGQANCSAHRPNYCLASCGA